MTRPAFWRLLSSLDCGGESGSTGVAVLVDMATIEAGVGEAMPMS